MCKNDFFILNVYHLELLPVTSTKQFYGSGSVCFRASGILTSCKYSKENIDFYCFLTSLWLLSLNTVVNVPSKSNNHLGILKTADEKSRIWIRVHKSVVRFRGSGIASVPKCHRSTTLWQVFVSWLKWKFLTEISFEVKGTVTRVWIGSCTVLIDRP